MRIFRLPPLAVWAARDVLRRPGEALLIGATLAALATVVATPLLLTTAVTHTSREILDQGPSLVLRRLGPQGWAPVPADESLHLARGVRGVTGARARIWGLVTGPDGPLTVMGRAEDGPSRSEAVVGPGVPTEVGDALVILGAEEATLRISERLDDELGIVVNDLVLLHPADARRVLGLAEDQASDLAIEVFHEEEQEAIRPDLARAFPWPTRITTRAEAIGAVAAGQARIAGVALIVVVPALLALCLLAAAAVAQRSGRRAEVALLRIWGWTPGDIARFFIWRAVAVGIPSVALGLAVAYAISLWPGTAWPGTWLLGWSSRPPGLHLDPAGAGLVLAEVGALILVPWLIANLWPALRCAARDPGEDLAGQGDAA